MKCSAPNIGIFYRTNQDRISPCCQYQQTWAPEDYDPSIPAEQIESSDDYIPNCAICQEQSLHKTTLREKFDQYRENYGSSGIVYADIRTSNYCNLQCNMCSPLDSSKIESYVRSNPEMEQYFKDVPREFENTAVRVPVDLSNLRVLKVAGGEPTIDPKCIEFLDSLTNTADTELWVTTNATRMLPFLRKYKPRFKRLCVTLSLDAAGKILEFIRYPADWHSIQANIDAAIEEQLCDDMNVNIVVQPFNILTVRSWAEWFSEFRERVPRTKIVFNECTKPKHFSLSAMPPIAVDYALHQLDACRSLWPNLSDRFQELESMLSRAQYREDYHSTLIDYMEAVSRSRNCNAWAIHPALEYLR
jgi:sulfatase maturation enzyme AslB (radical SAM superfamily)